jgi:hypothetical protein
MSSSSSIPSKRPPPAPDPPLSPSAKSPDRKRTAPPFQPVPAAPRNRQKGKKKKALPAKHDSPPINPFALYRGGFPRTQASSRPASSSLTTRNKQHKNRAAPAPGTAATDGHSAPPLMVDNVAEFYESVCRTEDVIINPNPTAPSALLPSAPTPTATSASVLLLFAPTPSDSPSECHRQYRRHRQ